MTVEHPYEIINAEGITVMRAAESCRYPRHLELSMMEAGYTIRLHGKKLTKTEIRKAES